MKSAGAGPAGYTILEVMIFLAVSGVMFLIAVAFINGKQAQAEFSQSVGDVSTHLQQVLNNVMNGFYPTTSQRFSCTGGGASGGPTFTYLGSGKDKGTNLGCVYIGEVVRFGAPGTNGENYDIVPVVGNQMSGTQAASSFAQAYPTALTKSVETHTLLYGMHVTDMFVIDQSGDNFNFPCSFGKSVPGGGYACETSGFGVFTTFGGYTGTLLNSGAQSIRLTAIPNLDYVRAGGHIDGRPLTGANGVYDDISKLQKKPDDYYTLTSSQYITICLKSGYDKPASVSLGNTKGNLSVATQTGASVAGVCSS